jgi:hypothetical protein
MAISKKQLADLIKASGGAIIKEYQEAEKIEKENPTANKSKVKK